MHKKQLWLVPVAAVRASRERHLPLVLARERLPVGQPACCQCGDGLGEQRISIRFAADATAPHTPADGPPPRHGHQVLDPAVMGGGVEVGNRDLD